MSFSPSSRFPRQRWQIAPSNPDLAAQLAQTTQLPALLAQVLINRGMGDPEAAQTFLKPETQILPSPLEEFPDLPVALEIMLNAIANRQPIAICGDYDADGMTSTALLLRALRFLGAIVDYAIPSRMQEGYGLNRRIVEEFYEEGVQLILTVDNGIAAFDPIVRARELGLTVIVTDHHDIPEVLPPANAILNPKLIREDSPYRGVAGVGVAYILAVCLAQCLSKTQDLTTPLIELFTLGTIADLAPLTGVNRRWVKRGLKLLPKSRIAGIQALIQVAGLSNEKALKPEAIGFRLGPRINAIGRLADPQIVIELLTTDDDGQALELAMKCEQVNQYRQRLCELIEQEAIAWCEQTQFNGQQERVLVIVQPEWHHGVIGIVASRLVERYGVPVFIGTYEGEAAASATDLAPDLATDLATNLATDSSHAAIAQPAARIRGSARGIPEFNVFDALNYCSDLLERFGGHRAAGGFTFKAENLEAVRSRLREFAHQTLQPDCLQPLITIDAQANLDELTLELFEQIDRLHPCGIENSDPVFWTPNVRIAEQQTMGRNQAHLKLTVSQSATSATANLSKPTLFSLPVSLKAIVWRWGEYYPLPRQVDIAYRLRLNEWNGVKSVELEILGVRSAHPLTEEIAESAPSLPVTSAPSRREDHLPHLAVPENLAPKNSAPKNLAPKNLAQENYASFSALEQKLVQSVRTQLPGLPTSGETGALTLPDDLPCFRLAADPTAPPTVTRVEFYYNKRLYTGSLQLGAQSQELRIRNSEGHLLVVHPQQRQGFLGKRREDADIIDVSQPYYFNLIRAALCALESAEKSQLLEIKEQQLAEKDQQIAHLTQQLRLLNQPLNSNQLPSPLTAQVDQAPAIQIPIQPLEGEAAIVADAAPRRSPTGTAKPEEIKRSLKAQLGESVWNQLSPSSQRDLTAAYKSLYAIQSEAFTAAVVDYSEAGLKLGLAIEREVVQLFFKQLYPFLQATGEPVIGGIALKARKKYTLAMLPPLLAAEWD
ncbi:MAG TPA: DHH family phosphoesterase, partial [Coleofasciculaceae cyanobacterium]